MKEVPEGFQRSALETKRGQTDVKPGGRPSEAMTIPRPKFVGRGIPLDEPLNIIA